MGVNYKICPNCGIKYNPEETKEGKCPKCEYNDKMKYDTRTLKAKGKTHFQPVDNFSFALFLVLCYDVTTKEK